MVPLVLPPRIGSPKLTVPPDPLTVRLLLMMTLVSMVHVAPPDWVICGAVVPLLMKFSGLPSMTSGLPAVAVRLSWLSRKLVVAVLLLVAVYGCEPGKTSVFRALLVGSLLGAALFGLPVLLGQLPFTFPPGFAPLMNHGRGS